MYSLDNYTSIQQGKNLEKVAGK